MIDYISSSNQSVLMPMEVVRDGAEMFSFHFIFSLYKKKEEAKTTPPIRLIYNFVFSRGMLCNLVFVFVFTHLSRSLVDSSCALADRYQHAWPSSS